MKDQTYVVSAKNPDGEVTRLAHGTGVTLGEAYQLVVQRHRPFTNFRIHAAHTGEVTLSANKWEYTISPMRPATVRLCVAEVQVVEVTLSDVLNLTQDEINAAALYAYESDKSRRPGVRVRTLSQDETTFVLTGDADATGLISHLMNQSKR